jgi:hypothetical protein
MVSDAQHQANIQNSEKSTGPTTAAGQKRSSMNAFKHGFAGRTVLILEEERPLFDEHFNNFQTEYNPQTETERFLVQSLAEISLSISRIRAHETNLMLIWSFPRGGSRYKEQPEDIAIVLNQAEYAAENAKTLNTLSIYEQRKMRLFRETLKELQTLQSARKAQQQEDLSKAAAVRKVMKASNQPWQPAEDGFVCSLEQIDHYLRRQERSDHHAAHSKAA